jgi:hypothetical protein
LGLWAGLDLHGTRLRFRLDLELKAWALGVGHPRPELTNL